MTNPDVAGALTGGVDRAPNPVAPETVGSGVCAVTLDIAAEGTAPKWNGPKNFRDHTNPVTMKLPNSWFPSSVRMASELQDAIAMAQAG
jgi:hypothetical protein